MKTSHGFALAGIAIILLAIAPLIVSDYWTGVLLGMTGYVTLATAWALFSGPTRYISLATVAFFGVGAYTVAVLNEALPYPLVLICAAGIGMVMALVVGLSTLRLAGVYFVIFTFGLAELVRQTVSWWEVNVTYTMGRYVFLPFEGRHIYWQLLALAVVTFLIAWTIGRSRIGLALKALGDDETVAAHAGVDVTRIKLLLFVISSTIITLVGAIQAPRWTYIEPSIVFNPTVSFMTLIMALLGGAMRLWGPLVGAVPLFLLFEWLSVSFPDHFSIILGLLFILIVFVMPNGVLAKIEDLRKRGRA
ncbi:branched-chain amino acid ABC transporter permease [Algicella marina]|uniref:Branched-chain amino acid ABC transporter permease n=2 Tax=Algicella marina TaxID=2683284 RepID=A0A6P1T773_9RHOB|nr:branched-chain amino acid ABC transporter permease [Algicella marina]